jgi:hypothetical protein
MSGLADEYEHVVYGTGRAQIRDPDGIVRDATPDELVRLKHIFEPAIKESFRVVVSEMTLPIATIGRPQ